MFRNLEQRRVLVTGASSGIGKAICEELAGKKARIALVARSADKLEAVAGHLRDRGAEALPIAADITNAADRQRLLMTIEQKFGGLDVLLNNAGIASWAHFSESTEAILREIMEVNFYAPAELMRAAIPLLCEGTQPAIYNVVSMCARRAMPAWSEYSASKHALCGLTESLRGEMVRYGIDVLMALPGLTRTGLHSNMLKNEGRAKLNFAAGMDPALVARKVVRALERNQREIAIGADSWWMLFFTRFAPRFVNWRLAQSVRKLYAAPSEPEHV